MDDINNQNDATETDAAEAPAKGRRGRPALRRSARTTGRANARVQPRVEAAAEEAPREEARGQRLQRRQRSDDPLFIDPKTVPAGVSYEWKRVSSYGQPDPHHQINLRENHWLPVPAKRHPELVANASEGTICYNGLILMERPSYLTKEARQEDFQAAVDQVRSVGAQVASTPDNTMTRDHPSVKANSYLKRSYEPVRVPE